MRSAAAIVAAGHAVPSRWIKMPPVAAAGTVDTAQHSNNTIPGNVSGLNCALDPSQSSSDQTSAEAMEPSSPTSRL